MSEKKLGIAVIGKPQSLKVSALETCGEYVAGCDLDESLCAEARQAYGIQTFSDYREMLRQPGIDVVYVKTPNQLHFEPTMEALARGIHVFCEKPLALSMDECRKMVAAAKENSRMLQINLELRSSILTKRVKEVIDEGEIGAVRRLLFTHYQGAWDHEKDHWRMDPARSGGFFLEKLVHEVDLFRWYAGEIQAVQSFAGDNVIPQCPYPDLLQSIFWFDSGALGSMMHTQTRSAMNIDPADYASHGHECWFDVVGTEGSLKADIWSCRLDMYGFRPGRGEGTRVAHFLRREDYKAFGQHLVAHDTPGHFAEFLRRIQAGEPELQPPDDVLKTMAATFIAERSIHTGKRERLDDA